MHPRTEKHPTETPQASNAVAEVQKATDESGDAEMIDQTASDSGKGCHPLPSLEFRFRVSAFSLLSSLLTSSPLVLEADSLTTVNNEQENATSIPPTQDDQEPTVTLTGETLAEDQGTSDKQDAVPVPTIESTPGSSRPLRKRAAPVKYTGVGETETPKRTPASKRPKTDKSWTEEYLLQNSNSRFGKVDLLVCSIPSAYARIWFLVSSLTVSSPSSPMNELIPVFRTKKGKSYARWSHPSSLTPKMLQ